MQRQERIYAAVRIVPLSYGHSSSCDYHVVSRPHFSFQTSMLVSKFDEIKQKITMMHGEGISMAETVRDKEVVLTVAYCPDYFDCFSDPIPFQHFVCMVENLWWNALADYRKYLIKSLTRC